MWAPVSWPLLYITVPPRAVANRPGGAVQLLRHDGRTFVPLAGDLGLHLAGGPALSGSAGRARVVMPLIFDNAVAVVPYQCAVDRLIQRSTRSRAW